MKTNFLFFTVFALLVFVQACKKDDSQTLGASTAPVVKTFISDAGNDGVIINSTPKVVQDYYAGGQGKEITIGWNASGYAMRGFLSFDISSIAPSSENKLVVDEAVLKVYEANTNLLPFTAVGARSVVCYLLDYGTLDATDYNMPTKDFCGTLATASAGVLSEKSLAVNSALASLLTSNPTTNKFQFRLQFSTDDNVSNTGPLSQAMWNVFAGDETGLLNYRPVIVVKYHYEKK